MTDKELFDKFAKSISDCNMISGDRDNTKVWIHTDGSPMELIHNGQIEIEWSTPSKEYPPPKNQLEPCRYCQMDMMVEFDNEGKRSGVLMHPQNSHCPWSGSQTIKSRWPIC